ncbi:hypothetical protein GCG54_00007750 [Colletotrichum gloeosporioides]|uniref:Uncharacterized protein n=1 Tax=Colletotrichum gloeosporioides TaxID=474922 RepID=A0A8H4CAL7_COLGL|nr:uncharacterized protein GCG54_00007750 [Colletotrichum gloeosporioides]KAF3800302.1 hypothetical protein GCG54_00007750 [Colletotrichum gloeosporioides]
MSPSDIQAVLMEKPVTGIHPVEDVLMSFSDTSRRSNSRSPLSWDSLSFINEPKKQPQSSLM